MTASFRGFHELDLRGGQGEVADTRLLGCRHPGGDNHPIRVSTRRRGVSRLGGSSPPGSWGLLRIRGYG